MFDFGYDEGGGNGTLLVSVQLGSCSSLKRLNRFWRAALEQYKVSSFHSKDYRRRNGGVFKGLSRARRRKLLAALARLIHKYMSAGMTTSINRRYYDSHTTPQSRNDWGSAYAFARHMATLSGYTYMKRLSARRRE
jgi:hypothetical protein